jgi:hypothetical protein
MAKKKISGLPAGSALNGTELVPIVQTGTTKRITTQDIANLGNASGVEGTGTINTLPKFTASSTIGDSKFFDDGTNQGTETTTAVNRFIMSANASIAKIFSFRSGNLPRWAFRVDGTESGANAGADLAIRRYNDAGTFIDSPLFIKRSSGDIGMGVTPSAWDTSFNALQIGIGTCLYNNTSANGTFLGSNFFYNGSDNKYISTGTATGYGQINGTHNWFSATSGTAGTTVTFTTPMSLNTTGGLSILAGLALSAGTAPASGIQFPATQVASASANNLDDYEEGTWTPSVAFGGASVGMTYDVNSGTYTKIGRQVTVNGYIVLTSKGTSTGNATITGLPFTVGNTVGNFGAASLWFNSITFTNQFQGRVSQNQNDIGLFEITILGAVTNLTNVDFANNSQIMISVTYFV